MVCGEIFIVYTDTLHSVHKEQSFLFGTVKHHKCIRIIAGYFIRCNWVELMYCTLIKKDYHGNVTTSIDLN